eukprot:58432-Chlamydomonas_euryale.AAC.1
MGVGVGTRVGVGGRGRDGETGAAGVEAGSWGTDDLLRLSTLVPLSLVPTAHLQSCCAMARLSSRCHPHTPDERAGGRSVCRQLLPQQRRPHVGPEPV